MNVNDQILKYGYVIVAYLAALGVKLTPTSSVWFVDSGHANTLDANDGEHGCTPTLPLATIDYAIGLCTAGNQDVIIVAPGHAETLATAAAITCDVDDVTIVGLGTGDNKPTITVTTDNNEGGPVKFSGNNITLKGIRFVGGKTGGSQNVIEINTSTYITIEDCDFIETANTLELCVAAGYGIITILDTTAASSHIFIRNNRVVGILGGDDISFLAVTDGSNGASFIVIEGNTIWGDFNDTVFLLDAGTNLVTKIVIRDNDVVNNDTAATNNIMQIDSGAVVAMLRNAFCTGAAGAVAPLANTAAAYGVENFVCEPNAYGLKYPLAASSMA